MKKTLSLLLVLMLAFCMALPAFADDRIEKTQPQTVTTTVPVQYKIAVVNGHAQDGAGNTITTAAAGETVQLVAHSFSGYSFVKWVPDPDCPKPADAKQAVTTFVMPAHDVGYKAKFKEDPKPKPTDPPGGNDPAKPADPPAPGTPAQPAAKPVPVTGDETRLAIPAAMAVLALAGVAVAVILKRRR